MTFKELDRQTERQPDKQLKRQMDEQIDKQMTPNTWIHIGKQTHRQSRRQADTHTVCYPGKQTNTKISIRILCKLEWKWNEMKSIPSGFSSSSYCYANKIHWSKRNRGVAGAGEIFFRPPPPICQPPLLDQPKLWTF